MGRRERQDGGGGEVTAYDTRPKPHKKRAHYLVCFCWWITALPDCHPVLCLPAANHGNARPARMKASNETLVYVIKRRIPPPARQLGFIGISHVGTLWHFIFTWGRVTLLVWGGGGGFFDLRQLWPCLCTTGRATRGEQSYFGSGRGALLI